ncbi:MAG: hypothetical protein ACK4VI_02460 [Alphaproteobacteria bacterium]
MAGPISGIGQQIPLATTFKPGSAENTNQPQVRDREEDTRTVGRNDDVRAQNAPTNQTQDSTNRNTQQRTDVSESRSSTSNDNSGEQRRGSVIDIQV